MANFFKQIFGVVFAEEDDKNITLRGMKVAPLGRDIASVWSTSKIEANMFSAFKSSHISLPKFFAPDFHYILGQILHNYKYRRTAKGVMHKALFELEENTWLKRLKEEHPKILDRSKLNLFKLEPLEHQSKFYDIYDDRVPRYGLKGYLLSAAAGSGKTYIGLTLSEMLHSDLTVIVCPKNAVHKVWQRHLLEEYRQPQDNWIVGDGGTYNKQKFIIVHYEALEKALAVIRSINTGTPVIILDESHNMNEKESLRTQHFIELCRVTGSKNVLWASGTPIKALGYESIPLLRTIDPLFTPDVEDRFKKIFGRDATRALDVLKNRLGIISYNVEKKDIIDNKAKTFTVPVKLKNGDDYTLDTVRDEMRKFITSQLKYYKDNFKIFEKQFEAGLKVHESLLKTKEEKEAFKLYIRYVNTIRKGYDAKIMQIETRYCNNYEAKNIIPNLQQPLKNEFKNAKSVVKYAELKVLGEALGGILGKKRSKCHVDMVPHCKLPEIIDGADKKTVIFTSYVEVVQTCNEYLKAKGYTPILVYGETTKNLAGLVTQFEKQPEIDPLVATYASLSTAVPLIAANVSIFMNSPFRDHELTQARARTDRLGQDTPVRFYNIVLDTGDRPNVSTRSRDILEWSREQVEAIMGKSYSGEIGKAIETGGAIGMEDFSESSVVSMEYHSDDPELVFDRLSMESIEEIFV